MTAERDLPRDIGGFIRDLRRNAQISLRQLAEQAGVSNPYLSQIERGLRKPSAEVLSQLAHALRVSTPVMYLRAGLLDASGGQEGVVAAIAADPDLTIAQKQSLTQIYETFRRENQRSAGAADADSFRFDQPVDEGTQESVDSDVDESQSAMNSAGRATSAAETAAARKATTRTKAGKTAAGRKSAATGHAAPASASDEAAAATRKPRKVAKRQPRAARPESSSEA